MQKYSQKRYKLTKDGRSTLISFSILILFMFSMYHQVFNDPIAEEPQMTPLPSNYSSSGTPVREVKSELANELGEVSLLDLKIREPGNYWVMEDIVNITPYWQEEDQDFLGTVETASAASALGSGPGFRESNITIKMNETIVWRYSTTPAGYIIGYQPIFGFITPKNMYLNGTRLDPSKYFFYYPELPGIGMFYDFKENYDQLIADQGTLGTLRIVYEYEAYVPISQWQVYCPGPDQYINDLEQTITQNFNYNMTVGKLDINLNVTGFFQITFPNPTSIHHLVIDSLDDKPESVLLTEMDVSGTINLYERIDKTIKVYLNTTSPHALNAHFKADFTVSFLDTVKDRWCEDRLVNGTTTRERDYKLTVTNGPPGLALTYIWINETKIWFPEVLRIDATTSRLGRGIQIVNMNKSVFTPSTLPLDDLPEEERPTYVDGIAFIGIKSPNQFYLFPNEVDIITIRYQSTRTLTVVIMDSIRTPLSNYQLKFHIGDSPYGTRLSLYNSLPHPVRITDDNGQVSIKNVPNANFTVEIFNSDGKFIQNLTANSTTPINFLVTDVVHFPATILVISGVSVAFILIGVILYRRNSLITK